MANDITLILGAGASCPYGFPDGLQLIKKIKAAVSGERKTYLTYDQNFILFSQLLNKSGYGSIDQFLSKYPELADDGKFFITKILTKYENCSALMEATRKPDRWYSTFFDSQIRAGTSSKIRKNLDDLRIVTFNYDRSFEEFLWNKLIVDEKYSWRVATGILEHLSIVHVHGQLGDLGWSEKNDFKRAASNVWNIYSPISSTSKLKSISKGIKIIHENLDTSKEFEIAKKYIESAGRVIFLGFSYQEDNMRRLGLDGKRFSMIGKGKLIAGTGYGLKPHQIQKLQGTYQGLYVYPMKIGQFLEKHLWVQPRREKKGFQ